MDTWFCHVSILRRFDCNTDTSVTQTLESVSLVSVSGDLTVKQTSLSCGHLEVSFGIRIKEVRL